MLRSIEAAPARQAFVRNVDLKGGSRSIFHFIDGILRDASLCDAPQDEVSNPHGEERVFPAALALSGARLEP